MKYEIKLAYEAIYEIESVSEEDAVEEAKDRIVSEMCDIWDTGQDVYLTVICVEVA